jgi:hypothetical protein
VHDVQDILVAKVKLPAKGHTYTVKTKVSAPIVGVNILYAAFLTLCVLQPHKELMDKAVCNIRLQSLDLDRLAGALANDIAGQRKTHGSGHCPYTGKHIVETAPPNPPIGLQNRN